MKLSELNKILVEDFWHLIGHISELPNPNDYLLIKIDNKEVVVFNDQHTIVAFTNACPHRGTKVFTGLKGNKKYLCSYHGWSYSDGKIKPTAVKDFVDIDFNQISLPFWKLERCGDFIFISQYPQKSLHDQLGSMYSRIEAMSESIETEMDSNHFEYECYWYTAVENALEPYHLPYIHGSTLNKLLFKNIKNELNLNNSILTADLGNESMRNGLERIKRYFDSDSSINGYETIFLYPFSFISTTYGYSYSVQNFFPNNIESITNFSSKLYGCKLKERKNKSILESFYQSVIEMNKHVFIEDHEICKLNSNPNWIKQIVEETDILSASEAKIKHFRQSCFRSHRDASR